ncbi:hypothetical protein FIV00_15175 [Labrenzia sp. THAF82]|nr:hypothetical protein FIV00_15175 [Labrenzia sp. THAF82]
MKAVDWNEVVWRRFGRRHEKPCLRPEVLTCALWECQKAGCCQAEKSMSLGTGAQILEFKRDS